MACNLQQKRIKLEAKKTLKSQDHQDISRPRKRRLCVDHSSPSPHHRPSNWLWCSIPGAGTASTPKPPQNSTRRVRPSHTLDLDLMILIWQTRPLWPKKFGHVIPVIPSHARKNQKAPGVPLIWHLSWAESHISHISAARHCWALLGPWLLSSDAKARVATCQSPSEQSWDSFTHFHTVQKRRFQRHFFLSHGGFHKWGYPKMDGL